MSRIMIPSESAKFFDEGGVIIAFLIPEFKAVKVVKIGDHAEIVDTSNFVIPGRCNLYLGENGDLNLTMAETKQVIDDYFAGKTSTPIFRPARGVKTEEGERMGIDEQIKKGLALQYNVTITPNELNKGKTDSNPAHFRAIIQSSTINTTKVPYEFSVA